LDTTNISELKREIKNNEIAFFIMDNLLEPENTLVENREWEDGVPLSMYLGDLGEDWTVIHNAKHIIPSELKNVIPKAMDIVVVTITPNGDAFKAVLAIAAIVVISYFTFGAGGLAIGAGEGAGFLGSFGGTFLGANGFGAFLAASAVFIGGSMLVNAILGPKPPGSGDEWTNDPTYGIDGPKNSSTAGIPTPVIIGPYRMGGNFIAVHTTNGEQVLDGKASIQPDWSLAYNDYDNYDPGDSYKSAMGGLAGVSTENTRGDQFLYMLVNAGEGEIEGISEVEINDQPISNFKNVEFVARMGVDNQVSVPAFNDILVPQSVAAEINTAATWVERQTDSAVDRVRVDVVFPRGLFGISSKGSRRLTTVNIRIEIKEQSSGIWLNFIDLATATPLQTVYSVTKNSTEAVRLSYFSPQLPTNAIYDVRVQRDNITIEDSNMRDMAWADMFLITDHVVDYNHTAVLGIKVKLDEQLNGIPKITFINKGIKLRNYDETLGWQTTQTDNPAWIVWNAMTNSRWGGSISESKMDLFSFREWAQHCNDENIVWRGVFERQRSMWDQIQRVLQIGRATIMRIGTIYSITIEKAKDSSFMINNTNIIEGSFSQSWISNEDRANEVEATYFDKDDGFRPKVTRVVLQSVQDKQTKVISTKSTYYGIDNLEQAQRQAQFELNLNALISIVDLEVTMDGLSLVVGDLVSVQHDQPEWGDGGKCVASSTTTVVNLDREVDVVSGTYQLMVAFDSLVRHTNTVSGVSGNIVSITGLDWTAIEGSPSRVTINGIEHTILKEVISGGADGVEIADVTGISGGNTASVIETDASEIRTITEGVGVYSILTASSAFSQAPSLYDKWIFGPINQNAVEYTVREISSSSSENSYALSLLEYNVGVFNTDPGTVVSPFSYTTDALLPVTFPATPVIQDVLESSFSVKRYEIHLNWSHSDFRYKDAQVWYSKNGSAFENMGFFPSSFSTEADLGDDLQFVVVPRSIELILSVRDSQLTISHTVTSLEENPSIPIGIVERLGDTFEDNDLVRVKATWNEKANVVIDETSELITNEVTAGISGIYSYQLGDNLADDETWRGIDRRFAMPVVQGVVYRLTATFRRVTGAGSIYIGVNGFSGDVANGAGALVNRNGLDSYALQHYFGKANYVPAGTSYETVEAFFTKDDVAYALNLGTLDNPHMLHPDVEYIAPMFIANSIAQSGEYRIAEINVETRIGDQPFLIGATQPTALTAEPTPTGIYTSWTRPPLSEYRNIRVYASSQDDWTMGTTLIYEGVSDNYHHEWTTTDKSLVGKLRYFWIVGVDSQGDESSHLDEVGGTEISTVSATGGNTAQITLVQSLAAEPTPLGIQVTWANPLAEPQFKEIVLYANSQDSWTVGHVEIYRGLMSSLDHNFSNTSKSIVGKTRYYWITSVNPAGIESSHGADISTVTATGADFAAVASSSLAAESSALGIHVTWDNPIDDPNYQLTRLYSKSVNDWTTPPSGAVLIWEGVASSYEHNFSTTDKSIINKTRYYWITTVNNAGVESGHGADVSTVVATGGNTTAAASSSLAAESSALGIHVTWDNPVGDASYALTRLYSKSVSNWSTAPVGAVLIWEGTGSFYDHNFSTTDKSIIGKTRYYWVTTVNQAGAESGHGADISAVVATGGDPTPPAASGSGLTAVSIPAGVRVGWSNIVAGEFDHVVIFTSHQNTFATHNEVIFSGVAEAFDHYGDVGDVSITGLDRFYWIKFVNANGSTSAVFPANVSAITATGGDTSIATPTGLTATSITGGVHLEWTDLLSSTWSQTNLYTSNQDTFSTDNEIIFAGAGGFFDHFSDSINSDITGQTRYYWIKFLNGAGGTSPIFPANVSAVTAVAGIVAPSDATNNKVWFLSSIPTSQGTDGDLAKVTIATIVTFYLKEGGSWGLVSDQTAQNISAGISAQGDLATQNTVDWQTDVSGSGIPADNATRNTITSGTANPSGGNDGDLYHENDVDSWWAKISGTWREVSDTTANNIAAAITLQGDLATQDTVDYGTDVIGTKPPDDATNNEVTTGTSDPTGGSDGDIHYKTTGQANWVKIGSNWTIVADTTGANTAADVVGQGDLATQNNVDWQTDIGGANKPVNNATRNLIVVGTTANQPANVDSETNDLFFWTTLDGGLPVGNIQYYSSGGAWTDFETNAFTLAGNPPSWYATSAANLSEVAAANALKFGGVLPSGYITTTGNIGSTTGAADDSDKLGGVTAANYGRTDITENFKDTVHTKVSLTTSLGGAGTIAVNGPGIAYVGSSSGGGLATVIGFRWNSPDMIGVVNDSTNFVVGTSSDYRLKNVKGPIINALSTLQKIQTYAYTVVDDESEVIHYGSLAHEVQEILPSLVTGEKDGMHTHTNEDGTKRTNPSYQSINYALLVPFLIESIKELTARVEELEKNK